MVFVVIMSIVDYLICLTSVPHEIDIVQRKVFKIIRTFMSQLVEIFMSRSLSGKPLLG